MSDIFNFSEIEEFDEFKFHLIEWNVDKILDSFKRYCSSSSYSSVDYEDQNKGHLSLDMRSNLVGSNEMRLRDKSLAIIENDKLTDEQNVLELDPNKNEELNSLDCAENRVVDQNATLYLRPRDFSTAKKLVNEESYCHQLRWSKQEDIKLFKTIKDLSYKFGIDIAKTSFEKGKVCKLYKKFFKELKLKVDWRGTLVELKNRIVKIKSSARFTARDIRVLKRYLAKEAKGEISMDQVLEQFPSKTLEQIIEFKNSLKYFIDKTI